MKASPALIPFAGSTLQFVRDGLERGERVLHLVRSQYRDEHLERLRGAGIDVATAQQRGQLEVAIPEETYLRGGRFDKEAVLITVQGALKKGTALGFPLTRVIAHAETVVEDWSNLDDWIEYEAQLSEMLPRYDDPVICTYDARLLNGSLAVDILRTHPVAVIGGRLYENPFYVPPHEFLEQVRLRGATPGRYGRMTALTT